MVLTPIVIAISVAIVLIVLATILILIHFLRESTRVTDSLPGYLHREYFEKKSEEKERVKTYGFILLGPIPIIFSSEKKIPKILLGLIITCLIIFLVISIYSLLLFTGVSL